MKNLKNISCKILFAAFCILHFTFYISCTDPYANSTFAVNDVKPISTYLNSEGDFSEWVKILKYADLYNALNQATQTYTAFVPDNEAVKKFYQTKGVSSIEDLGVQYAFDLVRYHVIGDSVPLQKFIVGGKIPSRTISQDYLTVTFDENSEEGGFNAVYLNKEARVKQFAIGVSNGYVYALEGVLTPILESVYEKMTLNGKFGIFLQALDATGWGDSLKVIYDEKINNVGFAEKTKRDYTVIGVSNDAFAAGGIKSLQDLKDSLSPASNDYTNTENSLNLYVAYHIIKGNYGIADLTAFPAGASKKMWGTLAEAVMEISKEADGKYWINHKGGDTVRAELNTAEGISDIPAKNGIIHQAAGYTPLWQSEEPVTVDFDFCDYPEIAAYIQCCGTDGQEFQKNVETEYRTNIQNVACYTVVVAPDGPKTTASYNTVDYFTVKTNGWENSLHSDQLILNIGYLGTIEMRTPIIIKGKYKLTLFFGSAGTQQFMRDKTNDSNGGEMEFSFDGANRIIVAPYPGITETGTAYKSKVIADQIEFTKTGSHVFKIVVRDPAARTGGKDDKFRIQLDYLKFEPI